MVQVDMGPMPTVCVICGGDGWEEFDTPLPAHGEFPEVKGMCGFQLCWCGSHCMKCDLCKEEKK